MAIVVRAQTTRREKPLTPKARLLHCLVRLLDSAGASEVCLDSHFARHSRAGAALIALRRNSSEAPPPSGALHHFVAQNDADPKTIHPDRRSTPRPGRCQTRETSIRVAVNSPCVDCHPDEATVMMQRL